MLTQSKAAEQTRNRLRLPVSRMDEGAQTAQLLFGVSFYGVEGKEELVVVVQQRQVVLWSGNLVFVGRSGSARAIS